MNGNLDEYGVPSPEAILVEKNDPNAKGVGEIANAVFHAIGLQVREFPITLDGPLG